ncbi:MAG TPA: amino acid ABC transporter substrate-binding protein [Stellaceae bacterium]|nr:amino acid ABC transporter substrate-binding protein [Stellaceae bacterium]
MKRTMGGVAAIAVAAGLAAATGPEGTQAAEPIRIGFSQPLTGGFASSGKMALVAMRIWAEDVNAKGGLLGRPVELVYFDDQSNPANVPGIYTKLLDVDKVELVVGPYGTVLTAPAMPVVIAHNMVITSLVSLAINERFHYPRYFSVTPLGPHPVIAFSKGFMTIAAQQTPAPKTIAIAAADQEFSKNNAVGARANAEAVGLKIVYDKTYPPSTTDFGPVIRAAQATGADIFYAASYPPDSVGLLRAAREIGYLPKMFGGSMIGLQTTTIQMQLGPLLNGVTTNAAWLPVKTLMFPGVMEMLKKYQAQAKGEGVDPLGYFLAPAAYAYIQLLGEAVEQAGTLDQAKLADYIHTHHFTTVYGDFDFAEDGEPTESATRAIEVQYHDIVGNDMAQFNDPAKVTIIDPPAYKTGTLVYPYASAVK